MSGTYGLALLGGALIGVAAAMLLLTHGRFAGISGITGAVLAPAVPREPGRGWRIAFVAGLAVAGLLARWLAPSAIAAPARSLVVVVIAGVVVGYGTQLGGGCTSGHGVCGLARGSPRSLVAVATFMTVGALTAWLAGPR